MRTRDSFEEWNDSDDDECFASAAGQLGKKAQQLSSQHSGLPNAFYNALNSVQIFLLSANIKTASPKRLADAMPQVKRVIAKRLVRIDLRYTLCAQADITNWASRKPQGALSLVQYSPLTY